MMIPLPGANTFANATREAMLAALIYPVKVENQQLADSVRVDLGGELRPLRTMQHLVVPDMLSQVTD